MDFIKKIFGINTNSQAKTLDFNPELTVILDVRTTGEYQDGHVQNAKNLDFYSGDFEANLKKLDKTKSYVLYCRSGNRSGQATRLMKQLGFTQAENLGSLHQASKVLGIKIV